MSTYRFLYHISGLLRQRRVLAHLSPVYSRLNHFPTVDNISSVQGWNPGSGIPGLCGTTGSLPIKNKNLHSPLHTAGWIYIPPTNKFQVILYSAFLDTGGCEIRPSPPTGRNVSTLQAKNEGTASKRCMIKSRRQGDIPC